ncbi:MAG: tetratricopeptide repeat protein [Oscillospiraceae bacterium]
MEQKKSKVIIISIVVALVLIVGTIATVSVVSRSSNEPTKVASQKLSLGQKFLLDLDYEKAVAEFNAVIDIEPKNADAYIGLADAYIGMGDEKKAIETLEKGLSETGDETIRAKLDEMKKPEETTAEVTTEKEKIKITASDVMNKVEEFNKYIETQSVDISNQVGKEFDIYDNNNTLSYIYLLNKDFISDEVRDELYEYGLPKDKETLKQNYNSVCIYIGYLNGGYSFYSTYYNYETKAESYISISNFILSDEYKMDIYKLDRKLYNDGNDSRDLRVYNYRKGEKICDFNIENQNSITEHTINLTYFSSNFLAFASGLTSEEVSVEQENFDKEIDYVIYDLLDNKV